MEVAKQRVHMDKRRLLLAEQLIKSCATHSLNGSPSHLPHPGFGMSGAGIMLNREPPRLVLINALMFCVKELMLQEAFFILCF